jgi:hypothetical protein
MKLKSLFTIIVLVSLFFAACEKNSKKPDVTLSELGLNNSKIGYIGADLHVEAEIVAEGKVETIKVEIHPESGTANWEFDTTYTNFSGIINPVFHEHIDIPMDADTGHYHFHFMVTDMEGQQTTVEEELELQQPNDDVAPVVNVTSAPQNNQAFTNGETITISGSVSDDKALGGMYIGLVRVDQNLTDAEVNATNTITMLHTHDFDSYTAYNFTASIDVGAAKDNNITPKDITGDIAWQKTNYYIVVKCKDAFGGNWTFSAHYPIVLN